MAGNSQYVLEVVLKARDELSKKVNDVTNKMKTIGTASKSAMDTAKNATTSATQTMKQQETAVNSLSQKYNTAKTTITNAMNNVKTTLANLNPAKNINSENISRPFKNAAETIRSKWQTVMQHIQSSKPKVNVDTSQLTPAQQKMEQLKQKINQINQSRATPRFELSQMQTADGQIRLLIKDLDNLKVKSSIQFKVNSGGGQLNTAIQQMDKIIQRSQKINSTPVKFNISNAGLATLNGQITTATTKVTGFGTAIQRIGAIAPNLGMKLGTGIASFTTRLQGARDKISGITSSMSMLSSSIMGAFGAVGVTSLSQFTIGAAIAREKINAITTSLTGSKAATQQLNSAITAATSGGVVGFNKVATAVQQIGIKHNLTNAQLEKTPPLLNKIGTLAMAMGKDGDTAATLMAKAYDGLNGNFMVLQRNFGITKQQLLDLGWSGAADDVDGYTQALQKALDQKPEMQEYLNSYEGQMARVQMAIQGVGRQIGEMLLPFINALLSGFLWLNEKCPWVTQALVLLGIAIVAIASAGMLLLPIIELLTIQIGQTTIGMWLLNAAMDANPIFILIVAIVALIAILAYLYTTNENVRKVMDQVAQVVMGILTNAWNTLMRIIQPLIPTFQHLWQVLVHLWEVLTGTSASSGEAGGNFDILAGIVQVLGWLFEDMVRRVTLLVEVFVAVLVPVINLVANVFSALVEFITKVIEAFGLLAEGDVIGFLATIGEALATFLLEVLTYLGQFVIELLNNLGTVFLGAGAMVGDWILALINQGIQGAIAFVMGFINWIATLPNRLWQWLMFTITYIIQWHLNIAMRARNAGIAMVTGFINYVSQLPGKLWNWLVQTATKIVNFAGQAYNNMIQAGVRMYNALKEKASQLPQVMWDELMHIGDKIRNAAGELGQAIIDLGKKLLTDFKHALGIASPGHMSHAIEDEMGYIGENMVKSEIGLGRTAESVGQSILDGFNSVDLSTIGTDVENSMPSELNPVSIINPLLNTTPMLPVPQQETQPEEEAQPLNNVLSPELAENSTLLADSFVQASALINPELLLLTTNLNNMAMASNTSTQTALLNNQQITSSYNMMTLQVTHAMTTIQQRNITAWNNIKQVTLTNLNSILNSTKSVTAQMIDAWQHMKNSIIQAAEDIKTQSSSRFDRLWATIKQFYHNIQHPGGAGTPNVKRRPNQSGGFKALSNIVKSNPHTNKITKQTFVNKGFKAKDLDYIFPNNDTSMNKKDLSNYLEAFTGVFGAGWGDVVAPNVKWIRDTTNEWETAPPIIINKYTTSQGFKVGDFENGTPNITFDYFRRMAEDVFSQCHYDFYWNSEKYGHWIPAFHAGYMNCDDSTEALMAMARACGLSASKVHGHWNQYGHYWANIAGHKMDTTGWMQRRTWTPAQSHAGSPTGEIEVESNGMPVVIELLYKIIDLLQPENKEPIEINLNKTGKVDVNAKHELTNLPNTVDENIVTQMINEATQDKEFIKALTSNDDFQYLDRKYKDKILKEIARFS